MPNLPARFLFVQTAAGAHRGTRIFPGPGASGGAGRSAAHYRVAGAPGLGGCASWFGSIRRLCDAGTQLLGESVAELAARAVAAGGGACGAAVRVRPQAAVFAHRLGTDPAALRCGIAAVASTPHDALGAMRVWHGGTGGAGHAAGDGHDRQGALAAAGFARAARGAGICSQYRSGIVHRPAAGTAALAASAALAARPATRPVDVAGGAAVHHQ